jgi:hypothetical protein
MRRAGLVLGVALMAASAPPAIHYRMEREPLWYYPDHARRIPIRRKQKANRMAKAVRKAQRQARRLNRH